MNKGNLYLVPATLAGGSAELVLPAGTLSVLRELDHFIVEELRTARRFLLTAGVPAARLDVIRFLVYNEHSAGDAVHECLEPALNGHHTGLLSEAGAPCVADPGAEIVRMAHEHRIRVVPLTGPSSLLLALMASGFNGQNFTFHGYLPADRTLREKKIRELERLAHERDQTQIFIETPYRNLRLFESLVKTCQPGTRLCIAASLTAEDEMIAARNIAEWRRGPGPDILKKPAIFLLYR
jgi:16S rRNA (cytidine1402-2'-O)-methyltransferase